MNTEKPDLIVETKIISLQDPKTPAVSNIFSEEMKPTGHQHLSSNQY